MTILFLISSAGYYGAENMLVSLAGSLRALGHDCVLGILTNAQGTYRDLAEAARKQRLNVELIPCAGRFDWSAISRIRQLAKQYDVDVLHPQGYKSDFYAFASTFCDRRALVATSHNWPSRSVEMRAYAALDRQILTKFDRVVVVADQVRERLLRAGVAKHRTALILNGVNVARFTNSPATLRTELKLSGHIVGFVGRLVTEKGGTTLLQAAQQILKAMPDTTFVFVGDGPCRSEWEASATHMGIQSNVVFVGSRSDMPGVYASIDVMVLPSLVEAMPMCLLEAMASAKSIVATRVGAIPEMVDDGQTGLLVAPSDAGDLARAIVRVLDDRRLRARLGYNARISAIRNYSSEVMANNYIAVYESVLAVHGRAPRQPAATEASLV